MSNSVTVDLEQNTVEVAPAATTVTASAPVNSVTVQEDGATITAEQVTQTVEVTGETDTVVVETQSVTVASVGIQGPPGASLPIAANDTEVLYRDGNSISGSPDFVFNDTLKKLTLGAGSQLLLPTGTAALPSLSFSGDPNTGIWNESGDIVTISCAGGSKYRFANSYVTFAPAGGVGQFGLGGTVGIPNAYLFGDSAGVLRVTGVSTETKFVVKAGSAQSLNLQEWQNSSGTALTKVTKDGYLFIPDGTKSAPSIARNADTDTGFYFGSGYYVFTANGTPKNFIESGGGNQQFNIASDMNIGWTQTGDAVATTADLRLYREAAGILAQRHALTPQAIHLYQGYVSGTDYTRLRLDAGKTASGQMRISADGLGSGLNTTLLILATQGTNRPVVIDAGAMSGADISFGENNAVASNYIFATNDAVIDLGKTTHRFRTGYFGGAAASIGLVTKAHASQAANLQEWQNSSGTMLSRVKSDGRWRHDGATTWEDLRFPAQGINPVGGAPDPTVDTSDPFMGTLLFSASATNVIAGAAQMPHEWKEGTTISPHIHWCPTSTDTGNVAWRFSYQISDINGTFPGTLTTAGIEVDAGDGTTNKHQIHGFTDISMSGKKISCMILWKLERVGGDASDTYTGDARLLELDFHYEVDSMGSDTLTTK